MDQLIAPHILALDAYEPGKPEEELQRELGLRSVVKLASNESAYGPSPRVLEALSTHDWKLHRYPDPNGHELRQALAAHHGVDPDTLALGNGSNELIDLLCRVCARRGDHAVFGSPSFPCYRIACVAQELRHTAVALVDHLHWNVDDLLGAVTPATKLLFLANPNNPTGAYLAADALERIVTEAPEDVLVVVDEAYVEYANADDYRSATELFDRRDRLAVLRTFSKAYGLAALRVGYMLGRADLVHTVNRLRAPFNVGTIGQRAAIVALGDRAHVERSVAACIDERRRLSRALRAEGIEVAPSQANFVLAKMPSSGREIYEALLTHGVIVRPMAPPIEEWIRVTVGLPEESSRFLEALRSMLRESRD